MKYINLSNISIVSLGFFFNFILFWNIASSFWLWMVVGMFESIKFQKSTLQKVAKFLKFLDFFRYFFVVGKFLFWIHDGMFEGMIYQIMKLLCRYGFFSNEKWSLAPFDFTIEPNWNQFSFFLMCGIFLVFHFYNPWKHSKTSSFQAFSGGYENATWHELD